MKLQRQTPNSDKRGNQRKRHKLKSTCAENIWDEGKEKRPIQEKSICNVKAVVLA